MHPLVIDVDGTLVSSQGNRFRILWIPMRT